VGTYRAIGYVRGEAVGGEVTEGEMAVDEMEASEGAVVESRRWSLTRRRFGILGGGGMSEAPLSVSPPRVPSAPFPERERAPLPESPKT